MSDAQKFIITKPDGKPLMDTSDVTAALFTASNLPAGTGIMVVEVAAEAETILPWRIVYHGDTTLAALDHYPTEDEVFAALLSLQRTAGHADDTVADLSVTYRTAVI